MVLGVGNGGRVVAVSANEQICSRWTHFQSQEKNGDSQFWGGLLDIKDLFYRHARHILGDVSNTRFWEYICIDEKAFTDEYPRLYYLSFDHNITVAVCISKGWAGFRFRRTLYGDTLVLWNSLKSTCEEIEIKGGKDKIIWTLMANGKFSVKSLYIQLVASDLRFPQKFLWEIKVPAKIKVFLWLVIKKAYSQEIHY